MTANMPKSITAACAMASTYPLCSGKGSLVCAQAATPLSFQFGRIFPFPCSVIANRSNGGHI